MTLGLYKEIIICIFIIALVVTLNICTENYTKESVTLITDNLETLKQTMEEENNEETSEQINNIIEEWDNRYKKLAYYIEHDELEKVETELVALKANIEVEEYEEGMPDLNRCIFILNHIKEKSALQIKNIF